MPVSYNMPSTRSVKSNTNNLGFKAYEGVFMNAMRTELSSRAGLGMMLQNLIRSLKADAKIDPEFLKLIACSTCPNGNLSSETLINAAISRFKTSNRVLARNYSNRELLGSYGDSLVFTSAIDTSDTISFSCTDKNGIVVSMDTEYSSDRYEFYPNGGLRSKTRVSGHGIGQTSDTTYYKKDGSEDSPQNSQ